VAERAAAGEARARSERTELQMEETEDCELARDEGWSSAAAAAAAESVEKSRTERRMNFAGVRDDDGAEGAEPC